MTELVAADEPEENIEPVKLPEPIEANEPEEKIEADEASEIETATNDGFLPKDMEAFLPTTKVGLIATVNPEGFPHITLITTLQAKTPNQLVWGQFTEGLSKKHVLENTKTGFLIMDMERRLWRGTATYDHFVREGEDYEMFNNKPMFRYNSYFGIHTVHYMDLVETAGRESLPLGKIVPASLLTMVSRSAAKTRKGKNVMGSFSQKMFTRVDSIKFLSYVKENGFPIIIPLLQCQAADTRRLVFSPIAYEKELAEIPESAKVAVFAMTFQAEDILVRGDFQGIKRFRGARLGVIDVDYVYNSMPPKHGQVYPPVPFEPVTEF